MPTARTTRSGAGPRALTAALAVLAIATLAVVAPSAGARGGNPPGANGTIKVDGRPFEVPPTPANEPHVGCVFNIDFAGFDQGDYVADVLIEAHPPTGRGVLITDQVVIGEDPAGGAVDHDATATYNLSRPLAAFEAHPQQGHHVKITVSAPGAGGKIATKHKVIWVQGCEAPPTEDPCDPYNLKPECDYQS